MKHRFQLATLVAAMVSLLGLTVGRAAALDQPVTVLTADRPNDVQTHVDAIEHAPDPSTAVTVYAEAKSVLPDDPKIDQAYLRRMVDFGLPQMADAQAHALVQNDPKDGLAWGVIAFSLATRGQTADALKDIATAAKYLPEDPFIQRTAGQLLAWYDTVADKSTLSDVTKSSVKDVRDELASQRAYVDAYQAARSTYEQGLTTPETGPATAEASPEETPPIVGAYSDYGYDYGAEPYAYGTYAYPYAYPTYLYPDYADYFPYGGGYYGGYWWPGPFSSVIVPGDDFSVHHRFFHHGPDLDDFIGFPGHRPFDRGFAHGRFGGFEGQHGFAGNRSFLGNRGFAGNRGFLSNHGVVGNRSFLGNRGFVGNRGLVTRAPELNRGFPVPHFNRGFVGRAPQHFTAPHFSRAPRFAHSAPRMAAPRFARSAPRMAAPHFASGPRFAAAPRFGGGHFGGGHFGGGHFGGGHFGGGHFGGGRGGRR